MKNKLLLAILALSTGTASHAQVQIEVDAARRGIAISPTEYGIFFEDINHAADGGLYAELIRNRSFEDGTAPDFWSLHMSDRSGMNAKEAAQYTSHIELTTDKLLNEAQGQALKWTLGKGVCTSHPVTLCNEGFWGIHAVKGRKYKLTLWVRTDGYKGSLTASLQHKTTGTIYGTAVLEGQPNKTWQKFTAEITSSANDPQAVFALSADAPGTLYLDVVSLFPPTFKNRPNGCRPELAQLLADMKPTFMRFPGGCFVEGQKSEEHMFKWKKTVGPIEVRPGHMNENWGYRTSDGLGYHEFLQLSEDLGAAPLFVVNVGIWHGGCRHYNDIQDYIQDALDAIEYANGSTDTHYGAMRAANGHPAPFGLKYIEIGNENYNFFADNNRDQSDHYAERYIQFYKAIKAKYPDIITIGNVESWGTDNPSWRNEHPVEIVDEHYYRSPKWFADNFHKYDNYDRNKYKVYTGEYAVTQNFGKIGNLNAALGEAVYMMGMENNSDVVVMNSYAPIFANENAINWHPDMIRFNSEQVFCTPSYYVQKLLSEHVGTHILPSEQTDLSPEAPAVPRPVSVGVGTWNTQASFDDMSLRYTSDRQPRFSEDFAATTSLISEHGKWSVTDGVFSQLDNGEKCIAFTNDLFSPQEYIYNVRARKDAGREGALILFHYADADNYCWLNLGGWGNSRHGIEACIDGNKETLASTEGKMEEGRWYDISIRVDKDKNITCLLDGKELLKATLPAAKHEVFSNATIDERTGEITVKVVNPGKEGTTAVIRLNGTTPKSGRVIRLTSAQGTDENTISTPTHVVPTEGGVTLSEQTVTVDVPAFSLNIVKLQTR